MIRGFRMNVRSAGAGVLLAAALQPAPMIGSSTAHAGEIRARRVVSTSDMALKLESAAEVVLADIPGLRSDAASGADALIRIGPEVHPQPILGLGSSLEPTTCHNISRLDPAAREEVIRRLFDPSAGIGFNLVRICIGTPDFTGEPWRSYDDMPPGETDPDLERFSIEADLAYILPVLRLARQANPDVLFFASPWSPPGWMTSTGDMIGGRLLPEWRDAYAKYFVRFIRAYEREGIPIHAVTVQNEPGVDRSREEDPKWHYPSCRWTGEEERDFIRDHLGPEFEREGLKTEIWCYDHNYNIDPTIDGDDPGIDYPRTVLSDRQAARHTDGVAFHGYAGKPEGMSVFASEFPGVPIHFTEGSVFGLSGATRLISLLSRGISSYNGWVTMLDQSGGPNNGPFKASATMIMLDGDAPGGPRVEYRFDYYMLGHFTKYIRRGARRIETASEGTGVRAIAYLNPDGEHVAVIVNSFAKQRRVEIRTGARGTTAGSFIAEPRSVSTLIWRPDR